MKTAPSHLDRVRRLDVFAQLPTRVRDDLLTRASAVLELDRGLRVGTVPVVEDRVETIEAAPRQALLVDQLPVDLMFDVVLRGDRPHRHSIQHG